MPYTSYRCCKKKQHIQYWQMYLRYIFWTYRPQRGPKEKIKRMVNNIRLLSVKGLDKMRSSYIIPPPPPPPSFGNIRRIYAKSVHPCTLLAAADIPSGIHAAPGRLYRINTAMDGGGSTQKRDLCYAQISSLSSCTWTYNCSTVYFKRLTERLFFRIQRCTRMYGSEQYFNSG